MIEMLLFICYLQYDYSENSLMIKVFSWEEENVGYQRTVIKKLSLPELL